MEAELRLPGRLLPLAVTSPLSVPMVEAVSVLFNWQTQNPDLTPV